MVNVNAVACGIIAIIASIAGFSISPSANVSVQLVLVGMFLFGVVIAAVGLFDMGIQYQNKSKYHK